MKKTIDTPNTQTFGPYACFYETPTLTAEQTHRNNIAIYGRTKAGKILAALAMTKEDARQLAAALYQLADAMTTPEEREAERARKDALADEILAGITPESWNNLNRQIEAAAEEINRQLKNKETKQ